MISTRLFSLSTIALQVHGNFLTKQPKKKKEEKNNDDDDGGDDGKRS